MTTSLKTLLCAGSLIGLAASAQAQLQSVEGFAKSQLAANPSRVAPSTSSAAGPIPSDNCATPDILMGQGVFPYDNTGATTGVEGQMETDCTFFGSSTIENDIWATWTADEDGMATISTCGDDGVMGLGQDTKIAVYDGTGCPTAPAIACDDDGCVGTFLSSVSFPVTMGTSYTLQLGNFPGEPGAPQNLTIEIAGALANDDCATPDVLVAEGMFPYDNTGATTGVEGQTEMDCSFFGSTAIDNDLWFSWTANITGVATINTCETTSGDTKIAAYDGVGCPTAATIACNDDTCGLRSEIVFDVTLGTTYTLQVGNFPGSPGGPQILTIAVEPDCYVYDDGEADTNIGVGAGGDLAWLQGFNAIGGSDVITEVSAAFGSSAATPLPPGSPGMVAVWDDPTNDFDPVDAVLLFEGPIVTGNEGTDTLNSYAIPSVAVDGVFFVGIALLGTSDSFPAPLDAAMSTGGRSYALGNTLGTGFNLMNLADPLHNVGLLDIDAVLEGAWVLRAVGVNCTFPVGTPLCDPGNTNSTGGPGVLVAEGSIVAADNDLTFIASGLPAGNLGLLVNSMNAQMTPINVGDGMLCIGPGFGRHTDIAVQSDMDGMISNTVDLTNLPRSSTPNEPALGGQTWYFQLWHRDGPGTSNFTNALEILFE